MPKPDQPIPQPAKEVDVEVLRPDAKELESPIMRFLATLMDDLFLIPGTRVRVGLDPILGLFPGFGDTSANFISAVALIETAKRGIPKIVLARMAGNILINAVCGCVPVLGDAFSVWFKSNKRNYELLRQYAKPGARTRSTRSDWLFVMGLVTVLCLAILLVAVTAFFITFQLLFLLKNLVTG